MLKNFVIGAAIAATAAALPLQAQDTGDAAGEPITAGHGSFFLSPYAAYGIYGELTEGRGLTLDDAPVYGAQLGYSFSPNIALIGNFGFSPTSFEFNNGSNPDTPSGRGDVDVTVYDANLQFKLPFLVNNAGTNIAPFAQVGAGAIKFSPDKGNELNDLKDGPTNLAFNAGLGVDFQIARSIGIRLMAKDYLTSLSFDDFGSTVEQVGEDIDDDSQTKLSNNIALSVGLNFGF